MKPEASVLVCTRNRSRSLVDACEAILAIDYSEHEWELVIVDNDSTDDTLEIARELERAHPQRIRVVQEKELGLSAARNRAIREARGRILAFIDDDAFPAPDWLTALGEALEQEDVLAAGGPVEPLIQGALPPWFGARFLVYLSAWDKGDQAQPLVYNEYPRGTNIAFRREAFERFGLFSTSLGRKGSSLLSGEEIELCLRLERGGARILYEPRARVRHITPVARITAEWMAKRFAGQGATEAIIDWRHHGFGGLLRGFGAHARGTLAARSERGFDEAGAVFARCRRSALHGYVKGALRAVFSVGRYRPSA